MVKIYLVRHCEAEGNIRKIFQGSTDCDISANGTKQLEFLKKRFENIHIDRAYSSPLIRAYKTALAAVDSKGIEVEPNSDFAEMHGGVVEGRPFSEIFGENSKFEKIWNDEPQNFAPEKSEGMRAVYERVKNGINNIAKDPKNEGKTLLVASHGIATRCLFCYLLYNDIEKLRDVPWAFNTAVSLVVYKDNKFKIELLNDDSHIPDELIPPEKRSVTRMWKKED
ncbi:MAG: histidine phosphatase family protein [Ruminococcaceae bacterium]|nr:histidine phosphatase family protein [Oscillospiraceae bacterium]